MKLLKAFNEFTNAEGWLVEETKSHRGVPRPARSSSGLARDADRAGNLCGSSGVYVPDCRPSGVVTGR